MRRLLRDYNLGLVLFVLFLASWVGQTWFGWQQYAAEQAALGEAAAVFGTHGYVWSWAQATFENWQSEFLQLLSMVFLTSFLVFRGSPESKDGDAEVKASLARLERRLDALAPDPERDRRGPLHPVYRIPRRWAGTGTGTGSD